MRESEFVAELSQEKLDEPARVEIARRATNSATKEKPRRRRRGLFAQPPKIIVKDPAPLPPYRAEALEQLIRKIALRKVVQMEHEQIKRVRAKIARTQGNNLTDPGKARTQPSFPPFTGSKKRTNQLPGQDSNLQPSG